jgi:hypothetical protein
MSSYYDIYREPSIYQTTATGGDSTAFIYNTKQYTNGGLIQLLAINQYNATIYAQVLNAPFPTGVAGVSGLKLVPTGVATGFGSFSQPTSGSSFIIGSAPVAVLAVPTGPGQAKLDLNTAHWAPCPSGMVIAMSSSAASYQPINTGCANLTAFYKP